MQCTLLFVATVISGYIFMTLLNCVKILVKNLVKVSGDVLVYAPGVIEFIYI